MVISLVNAIVNVVLNYVFMKSMGVAGIALSTSFVYLFSCLMVYGWIRIAVPKKSEDTGWRGTLLPGRALARRENSEYF
jgi:peptidoglycan biosynthesis protein MviN/MurJ (putative lipid II flippase)